MKFLQKNRFETCSFEAATSYHVAVDENVSFLLSGTASWLAKGRLPLENIFQKLVSYTWFTVTEKSWKAWSASLSGVGISILRDKT